MAATEPASTPAAVVRPTPRLVTPPVVGVIRNLIVFSILMVTVPLGLFYLSVEGYVDPIFKLTFGVPTPEQRGAASAIVAVIGVNIVVGTFVFVAFREVNEELPADRQKKKQPAKAGKQE